MNRLRRLYYALPPPLRFAARRLWYAPVDICESLSGRRDPLTPPRGMIFTGGGDFRKQGNRMTDIFRDQAGLQPHHRVLDVGSGIGRIAAGLSSFLDDRGSYEGFDVVPAGVNWCRKHISSRFPRFHFQYIPLANDLYRADGLPAARFAFPYPDSDFNFACAISVFTHMLPDEVAQYLGEIRRTLKPGGRCCCTFFLLNTGSEQLLAGNPGFQFPYDRGHYRLMDERVKAANVAYQEKWLRDQLKQCGLALESVLPGYWCGRSKEKCLDFQDIVIFKREM